MKNYLILIAWLSFGIAGKAQNNPTCFLDDFTQLAGSWQGSLTYLDYTSGKPVTIMANLVVYKTGDARSFRFSTLYPKEPQSNSVDTLSLSDDCRYINTGLVKSRKALDNGLTEIITEENGRDGNENKKARIQHTYLIGKETFIIRKEIQFEGDNAWIRRHEYAYKR